jgi:hypothetical protein
MAGKDRVAFNVKVSNAGGGTPLYSGTTLTTECPNRIDAKNYNIVRYDVEMVGGQKVKCAPEIEGEQRIRLVNNAGTIYCSFKISGDSAYTTPLKVTLDYNYMDTIQKDIQIIKTPQ